MKVTDDCKCREEKYAEKWLSRNGYNYRLKRRTSTKTVYLIWDDDGNEMEWTLLNMKQNMNFTMGVFQELFEAKKG